MALSNSFIEDISASLVREYLSRKGLKTTLQVMDEEMPRSGSSISNRQALMKEVKIEKLMKKNKDMDPPLRTMIEVMSRFFMEKTVTARDSPSLGLPAADCPSPSSQPAKSLTSPRSGSRSSNSSSGSEVMMTSKTRPSASQIRRRKCNDHTDIVIEDDIESETLLGEGKSGIFSSEMSDPDLAPRLQTRPLSSKRRPMPGAILSNLDDSNRRRNPKPRFSASSQSRPVATLPSTASNSSLEDRSDPVLAEPSTNSYTPKSRTHHEPQPISRVDKDTEVKGSRNRVSIEDVLEKSSERLDQISRRNSQSEVVQKKSYSVDMSSMSRDRPKSRTTSRSSEPVKTLVGDVEFGDMDDLENEVSNLHLGPTSSILKPNNNRMKMNSSKLDSQPIDTKTAVALKVLIHGTATLGFNDEWFYQSLGFCDLPELQYGIVQKKGGPCGVMASIQACMLQEMLFGEHKLTHNKCLDPSRSERSTFLARALSHILWRAGDFKKAVVSMPSGRPHVLASAKFKHDNLTETLTLYTFTKYEELLSFMKQSISQFELDGNNGVILVLYSALLSRGLDRARGDLDETDGKLMAAHGYCTQEMVNLLLTGRAVANVFNDVMELDSGNDQVTILKGVHARSDIGFLSLFEHYKSCQVGTYYKTPKFPIWVVCSESHFSVLFSIRRELISDWKAERRFDLYYYDGLARQQEQIKLTVDTSSRFFKPPSDEELVPPLDHCIRTKWADAEVDWNGYEPIL
ncbi:probable ubiquitin carboxyl-terminal hydrolase MINDY-4 [Haliotis cracherodii]|uniref:probable ubiquitin carboxyl-terminal hydrolase MINDY-4 n=1 Tax=Haliotis cracherodii TaxID=6455 RepID=UPI0039ED37B5